MATSEHPDDPPTDVGMNHPTVVPTNFDPEATRRRKRERRSETE